MSSLCRRGLARLPHELLTYLLVLPIYLPTYPLDSDSDSTRLDSNKDVYLGRREKGEEERRGEAWLGWMDGWRRR